MMTEIILPKGFKFTPSKNCHSASKATSKMLKLNGGIFL